MDWVDSYLLAMGSLPRALRPRRHLCSRSVLLALVAAACAAVVLFHVASALFRPPPPPAAPPPPPWPAPAGASELLLDTEPAPEPARATGPNQAPALGAEEPAPPAAAEDGSEAAAAVGGRGRANELRGIAAVIRGRGRQV